MDGQQGEGAIPLFGTGTLAISAGPTPLYNLVFFDLDLGDGCVPLTFALNAPEAALAIERIEDSLELISDPPAAETVGFDPGAAKRVLDAGRKLRRAIAGAAQ